MVVPVEFKQFTRLFLRGSLEWTKDMDEFIDDAIDLLDAKQKPIVKSYLDEILSSQLDEDDLNAMWMSCSPNYWIKEGEMREFLMRVRQRLDR